MKNLMYSLLFFVFLFISCGGNENNISMYGYELGQNKIEKLKLNSDKTDTIITFKYIQKSDSLKNITLRHHLKKDVIIVDLDTFNKIPNIYKSKSLVYKMYQLKKDKKRYKTLVFNENYGLIASLGSGTDRIFLEDSITPIVKEFIFKDLFINVNSK